MQCFAGLTKGFSLYTLDPVNAAAKMGVMVETTFYDLGCEELEVGTWDVDLGELESGVVDGMRVVRCEIDRHSLTASAWIRYEV